MKRISIGDWIYEKIRSAIAIVQDGDTATRTIASGKYVIWKGILCKAKAAIPSGTTLSSTNLEAVSNGGLNELHSDIETLNSKFKSDTASGTTDGNGNIKVATSVRKIYNAVYAGYCCIPFYYAGETYIKVVATGSSTLTVASNLSVNITYDYID